MEKSLKFLLRDFKLECKAIYVRDNSKSKVFNRCKLIKIFYGEFDPGSGLTLAACLTHASRTEYLRIFSGERVSNVQVMYLRTANNKLKSLLIRNSFIRGHPLMNKDLSCGDQPVSY